MGIKRFVPGIPISFILQFKYNTKRINPGSFELSKTFYTRINPIIHLFYFPPVITWRSMKSLGLQRGFEPVTSGCRFDAVTNWAMKPLMVGAGHCGFKCSRDEWINDEMIWNKPYIELRLWNQVKLLHAIYKNCLHNCEDHKFLLTSQKAHQAGAYHGSGFRSMKRLGVFLLPPGRDASPLQGYPSISPVIFIHLGGERHCGTVSCPRTQHSVPGQDPNPDNSIRSRAH